MSRPPCNKRVEAPCLNCEDRELGCHDKCERYKAFREELQTMKRLVKESRNYEHDEYKLREWPKYGGGGRVWRNHRK